MDMSLDILLLSGLSTLILVVSFVAVALSYHKLLDKYYALKKNEDRLNRSKRVSRRTRKKARKIIEEAMDKSQKIIDESSIAGLEMMNESVVFSQEEKKKMLASIEKISVEQSQEFQKMLIEFKNSSINLLSTISNDVKNSAQKEVEVFRVGMQRQAVESSELLKNMLIQSQKTLNAEIEKERESLRAEIESYKQKRLQQVNEQANAIVKELSKEILGKELTLKDHEELIVKTLEKGKGEGIF